MKDLKVYLASPFFNPRQVEKLHIVEKLLETDLKLKVYSPSRDGIKLDIKTSTYEDRLATFNDNVKNIDNADIVVAIVDELDTGTLWEVGYAKQNSKPIFVLTLDQEEIPGVTDMYLLRVSEDYNELREQLNSYINTFKVLLVTPGAPNHYVNLNDNITIKYVNADDIIDVNRFINFDYYDMIACNIDGRNPVVASVLGSAYAASRNSHKSLPNIVTYTEHDFGVNIMLMHSIAKHVLSEKELYDYIVACSENHHLPVFDDKYAREATDFE